MTTPSTHNEPFDISLRFYQALQASALRLEGNAQKDELTAASLDHPDHRRRQHRLIQAQREQARRLRDFLAVTRVCEI